MSPKFPLLLAGIFIFAAVELSTGQTKRYDVPTLWTGDTIALPTASENKFSSPCDTVKSAFPAFTDTIEMKVGNLTQYGGTQYIVELEQKKKATGYVLPVVIGSCEMNGLYSAIHYESSIRPMTYDLVTTVLKQTGVKLRSVVITKLQDGVFYAVLLVENQCQCQKLAIDARPSDAINLAVRAGVRIYAERAVWNDAKEKKE